MARVKSKSGVTVSPWWSRERVDREIELKLTSSCKPQPAGSRPFLYARKAANNEIRLFTGFSRSNPNRGRGSSDVRRRDDSARVHQMMAGQNCPLDICSKGQRAARNKGGWGKLARDSVFGKRARHFALEAGAVMDDVFKLDVAFATTTIPGGGDACFRAVAEWSGYIVNRMTQYLRRNYEKSNYIYVWEWQRRGALHLHVAFAIGSQANLVEIRNAWINAWFSALRKVSLLSGVDLFQAEDGYCHDEDSARIGQDVQQVYKSVGRYLSKYLSKRAMDNQGRHLYCPGRWWGASVGLRNRVRALREGAALVFPRMEDALQALRRYVAHTYSIATHALVVHNPVIREDSKVHFFIPSSVFRLFWRDLKHRFEWERLATIAGRLPSLVTQLPLRLGYG